MHLPFLEKCLRFVGWFVQLVVLLSVVLFQSCRHTRKTGTAIIIPVALTSAVAWQLRLQGLALAYCPTLPKASMPQSVYAVHFVSQNSISAYIMLPPPAGNTCLLMC